MRTNETFEQHLRKCNLSESNSTDEMFELYSVPNFDVGVPEIIIGKEIGSSKQSSQSKSELLWQ